MNQAIHQPQRRCPVISYWRHWFSAGTALLALLSATVLWAQAPAADAQLGSPPVAPPLAGDWHGVLKTPMGELTLILSIRRNGTDAWVANLESPDQAPGQKIPVTAFAAADGKLSFSIPAINATYAGDWQAGQQHWQGVFTQGVALALNWRRGLPPSKPVIAELDGLWEGSVQRNNATLRLLLRVSTGERSTTALLDSPDLAAFGLPVTALSKDGQQVQFTVPATGAQYRGRLSADSDRMHGPWRVPGRPEAEVVFVRTRSDAARVPPERPQLPREPLPYHVREVRFANPQAAGVELAGTLTMPAGAGPFPAAVLLTGSGAQDRDETVFGHQPFAVLADHLTRQGLAVLRYDDRGFGESSGDFAAATSADFATDANAAVAYLRGRAEIDGSAIGLIGHSEGGLIAPIAAVDNDAIAYLVLLAGPGTDMMQLLREQRRLVALSQGASAADLARTGPVVNQLLQAVQASSDQTDAKQRLLALLTPGVLETLGVPAGNKEQVADLYARPWFRYFLQHDPAVYLRQVNVPVLALNGTLDQQVPADTHLPAIQAALAQNADVTVQRLEQLNHLFQTAQTGAIGEYADITETFAPCATRLISEWICQRFACRP